MTYQEWLEASGVKPYYVKILVKDLAAGEASRYYDRAKKLATMWEAGNPPIQKVQKAPKRQKAADLDALVREGFVLEFWHDAGCPAGEEFCCAVSRGTSTRLWSGWGPDSLSAASIAVKNALTEPETVTEVDKKGHPRESLEP